MIDSHQQNLKELQRRADGQRNFAPVSQYDTIHRPRFTTANGAVIEAVDYGYRTFPMMVKRPKSNRPRPKLSAPPAPFDTGLKLANGLKSGDRVFHSGGLGKGVIIAVHEQRTFVRFDMGYETDFPTPTAHLRLFPVA